MNAYVSFNRDFAEFGNKVRPFERANDVGYVVTELMWYEGWPYYPTDALMDATITSLWLGEGEPKTEESIDLVLRFSPPEHDAPENYYFFEIIIRGEGEAYYGGFCDGTSMHATDEIVNGHRVIETEFEGSVSRWVYTPGDGSGPGQYKIQQLLGSPSSASVRRRGKRVQRAR